MYIADTSFIIDLINGDDGAIEKAKELDQNRSNVAVSSITVEEYLRGIYYLFSDNHQLLQKKMLMAEGDLARFQCLDVDYNIAKLSAQIDAKLIKIGEQIGFADVLIGATAKYFELKILTRNVKHFSKIVDLKIEKY